MTGMTTCPLCPGGYYQEHTGRTQCTACGIGKYNENIEAISAFNCTNCPAGKYSGTTGNNELSDCMDCEAGKYHETYVTGETTDANCQSCPEGYWSDPGTAADYSITDPTIICYCNHGFGRNISMNSSTPA